MKNLIAGLVVAAVVALVPGTAFAETNTAQSGSTTQATTAPATQAPAQMWGNDLRHGYTPVAVNNNQWVRARVHNVTGVSQNELVCVEAFGTGGGKTHLGCLTIPWQQTNWVQEFDAPLTSLGTGTYNIAYTYRMQNGNWAGIKMADNSQTWSQVTR